MRSGAVALAGPTLYVSGPFLQHAPYPDTEACRWGISGAADARAKVRKIAEARAATYWPSVAMKVDKEVGTVSPGKMADVIAVRGDVLRHIDLLSSPALVIRHGKRHR